MAENKLSTIPRSKYAFIQILFHGQDMTEDQFLRDFQLVSIPIFPSHGGVIFIDLNGLALPTIYP